MSSQIFYNIKTDTIAIVDCSQTRTYDFSGVSVESNSAIRNLALKMAGFVYAGEMIET